MVTCQKPYTVFINALSMFDRILNTPLPSEEKKDIRDGWLTTINWPLLPKAIQTCLDRIYLLILIYLRGH